MWKFAGDSRIIRSRSPLAHTRGHAQEGEEVVRPRLLPKRPRSRPSQPARRRGRLHRPAATLPRHRPHRLLHPGSRITPLKESELKTQEGGPRKIPSNLPKLPPEPPRVPGEAQKIPVDFPRFPGESPRMPAEPRKIPGEAPQIGREVREPGCDTPGVPARSLKPGADSPQVHAEPRGRPCPRSVAASVSEWRRKGELRK